MGAGYDNSTRHGYFRVDFEYLNLEWQEAQFTEVFDDPKDRMSFIISNKQLPCNDEFIFVAKAYGVNGNKALVITHLTTSHHVCR